MKRLRPMGVWVFLAAGCAAAMGAQGIGGMGSGRQVGTPPPVQQAPSRAGYPGMGPMGGDPTTPPDILSGRIAEQQARSRNNERQKRLEQDTEKLVDLTKEFHEQVDGEKPMSPDDVGKRAEEIEKLARSVKDRMRG